ncbi:hypothetical protein FB451DRAFT_1193387 [Mycena latifolia]|nr:hypothetical protein FB451DRAFT_1193387 [Mycena latifolia]
MTKKGGWDFELNKCIDNLRSSSKIWEWWYMGVNFSVPANQPNSSRRGNSIAVATSHLKKCGRDLKMQISNNAGPKKPWFNFTWCGQSTTTTASQHATQAEKQLVIVQGNGLWNKLFGAPQWRGNDTATAAALRVSTPHSSPTGIYATLCGYCVLNAPLTVGTKIKLEVQVRTMSKFGRDPLGFEYFHQHRCNSVGQENQVNSSQTDGSIQSELWDKNQAAEFQRSQKWRGKFSFAWTVCLTPYTILIPQFTSYDEKHM